MIKLYQYPDPKNVGDNLSLPIVKHFLRRNVTLVPDREQGKLLAVGSIMGKLKPNDVVWGTGCSRDNEVNTSQNTFLAVRGKMTKALIKGEVVPEIYGDPALLLPLLYNPPRHTTHKVGFIPHYIDKPVFKLPDKNGKMIDVNSGWKRFVDQILSCERIVSSSLHGIIVAEAYGVPAEWAVYTDKIYGGRFKFKDYQTGTQRDVRPPGPFSPIPNLADIQTKLISALLGHFGKADRVP